MSRIGPNLLQRTLLSVGHTPTALAAGPRTGKTMGAAMLAARYIAIGEGDFVYIAPDRHQADYFISSLQGIAGSHLGRYTGFGSGVRQARYGPDKKHMLHVMPQGSLVNFYHCDYSVAAIVADNSESLEVRSQEIIAAIGLKFKCRTILLGTIVATSDSNGSIVVPPRPAWTDHDGWDYTLFTKGVFQKW